MSQRKLPSAVVEGLEYLREIGFSELCLDSNSGQKAERLTDGQAPAGELSSDQRRLRLQEVGEQASTCERCNLSRGRNRAVFGSGRADADLMLIGEGPGAEEDRQGLPFVGPAGELLTLILKAIGLERDDVYIANIVKCRPPGNRDPLPEEASACRSFLDLQIELVRPKVIVALGRVAAQDLVDSDLALGRLRNQWHRVRGIPTRVTYHPAALLRNSSWKRPTWEDMQVVRDRLLETSAD